MKAADLLKPGQQSFTKTCIDSGVFSEIINILGKVTNEFKRENVSKAEESEESDEELQVLTSAGIQQKAQSEAKRFKKKTAEAHAFSGSTSWDIQGYLKSKEDKGKQTIKVLAIMEAVVHICQDDKQEYDDEPLLSTKDEKKVVDLFLQSALLPVLEAALRAGTILEMAKSLDLYLAYLSLVEAIAHKQNLICLLLDIGDNYQPRQQDSLSSLLKQAADMA